MDGEEVNETLLQTLVRLREQNHETMTDKKTTLKLHELKRHLSAREKVKLNEP